MSCGRSASLPCGNQVDGLPHAPSNAHLGVWRAVWTKHGSKNLFQRAILYRHKRYNTAREDCRQDPGEKMCIFMKVFHQYLRIGQFVWARVLLCTRYYQSASVGCNGVILKIHRREDEVGQGFPMMMIFENFMVWGRLTRPNGPSRAQGSALTRNEI